MPEFGRTLIALRIRSTKLIDDIIDDLNAKEVNATGTLAKSLKFTEAKTPYRISVNFKAKDYWKWVDKGRKPGKMPPPKPLIRWARVKLGLSTEEAEESVFAISRAIAKKGTKGTNIFTNNINKFKKDVEKFRDKELKTDISESIRKALR